MKPDSGVGPNRLAASPDVLCIRSDPQFALIDSVARILLGMILFFGLNMLVEVVLKCWILKEQRDFL